VLINGMPACAAGAMGYSVHIPQGIPTPPSMLNQAYWRRHLLNIPKQLMLVALTLLAIIAIAGISSLFVKPDSAAGRFIKDATGVDSSSHGYYGITDGDADVQGHRSGSSVDPFQGSQGACHGVGVPSTPGEHVARACA